MRINVSALGIFTRVQTPGSPPIKHRHKPLP
jgi:hypothetical protein